MTGCQCDDEPGLCIRHGCVKTRHYKELCRTRPDYFAQWEAGNGPCIQPQHAAAVVNNDRLGTMVAWHQGVAATFYRIQFKKPARKPFRGVHEVGYIRPNAGLWGKTLTGAWIILLRSSMDRLQVEVGEQRNNELTVEARYEFGFTGTINMLTAHKLLRVGLSDQFPEFIEVAPA